MNCNYVIILFKNKVRYKIIKKYQTYKKSKEFFDKLIDKSNNVVFNIESESGRVVEYEIALVGLNDKRKISLFKQDELGRNLKIETDDSDFNILELKNYRIPEKIFDVENKRKINSDKLIEQITKGKTLKLISKLNNKIIIQEDYNYRLFSLKNIYDAERFIDSIEKHIIDTKKNNCLVVKDSSKEQKKYLYSLLSDLGFDRKMLYRKHTTYSKDI